jgi:hypothetical protein
MNSLDKEDIVKNSFLIKLYNRTHQIFRLAIANGFKKDLSFIFDEHYKDKHMHDSRYYDYGYLLNKYEFDKRLNVEEESKREFDEKGYINEKFSGVHFKIYYSSYFADDRLQEDKRGENFLVDMKMVFNYEQYMKFMDYVKNLDKEEDNEKNTKAIQ